MNKDIINILEQIQQHLSDIKDPIEYGNFKSDIIFPEIVAFIELLKSKYGFINLSYLTTTTARSIEQTLKQINSYSQNVARNPSLMSQLVDSSDQLKQFLPQIMAAYNFTEKQLQEINDVLKRSKEANVAIEKTKKNIAAANKNISIQITESEKVLEKANGILGTSGAAALSKKLKELIDSNWNTLIFGIYAISAVISFVWLLCASNKLIDQLVESNFNKYSLRVKQIF